VKFVNAILVNVGMYNAKRCRIPQEEEKAWEEKEKDLVNF